METRHNIHKIIGPPGVGKSTELLRMIGIDAEMYGSSRIGAISYTKAAVETIRDRITQAGFDVPKNVRTLHSHCFGLLGLKKEEVADSGRKHKHHFGEEFPHWRMLDEKISTEDMGSEDYGDVDTGWLRRNTEIMANVNVLRNRLIPVEQWPDFERRMWADWFAFMEREGIIDYTGMLERVLEDERIVYLDSLFVDEAQDMSPLAAAIVLKWAKHTKSTTFFGDANQCVYFFSGAEPEVFMNLPAKTVRVLDQSYRVPRAILDYSQRIIKQAAKREDAFYRPCDRDGDGKVYVAVSDPDLSLPGTHMLLGRTNRDVNLWIKQLLSWGILWHNPLRPQDMRWNPTSTAAFRAYHSLRRIMDGDSLTGEEVVTLAEVMKAKGLLRYGLKQKIVNWKDDKLNREYTVNDLYDEGFPEAWLDGKIPLLEWLTKKVRETEIASHVERLYSPDPPKVLVGTCHSVKGGEADHVWVDARISRKQYNRLHGLNNEEYTWDDECRLAYVAATRARKTLGIMTPPGRKTALNDCFPGIFTA